MKIKKIIIIFISLVMILFLGGLIMSQINDNKYVNRVKNGHPNNYPNSTYDEAFKKFFGSPTWKYFKSDDGKDVVEFTGTCTYQNVNVKAKQQFILNTAAGTFEAGALSFNDVPQNALITAAMLSKVFDSNSTTKQDAKSTIPPTEKKDKVSDAATSANNISTENQKYGNKDEVKKYVTHDIFNDDLSQISNLNIGNPIVVNNTTYYGVTYTRNNGVKLLCLDYTNKKTLSYDEMDAILAPLGKSHNDLTN